jgi:type IV pilus assembly protein PilN
MKLINLRSWREDRRHERQQQFIATSVGMVVFAAVLVIGAGFYMNGQITKQQARNDYLRQETSKLDVKIREIKALKEKRERLLERLQAIQELQGNRPVIVHVLDELVRVLPEQVYYNSVSRKGDTLSIQGMAEANTNVSGLMRNMDSSDWFKNPNLRTVTRNDQRKQFVMSVRLSKPVEEKEGS